MIIIYWRFLFLYKFNKEKPILDLIFLFMQYEIDFLPVGEWSKWWDAIAIRYWDFSNRDLYKVIVIDWWTKASWKLVVDHIKKHFFTNYVDVIIATHFHQDHIWWISEILDELSVWKIIMHLPWTYSKSIKKMTITEMGISKLAQKLEKSMNWLSNLEDLANKKNIPIQELFAWEYIFENELIVLWPSLEYYEQLLANFAVTPETKSEHTMFEEAGQFVKSVFDNAIEWMGESLHIETLTDDYEDTSPENNSSIVLLLQIGDKRMIFTGDCWKDGLNKAIEFADKNWINVSDIDLLDIPHHWSKRNVWPSILDRLRPKVAFISCPKDGDPKHPSRKVINALIRRGCDVHTTKGNSKKHWNTTRDGWNSAIPETFYHEVEN